MEIFALQEGTTLHFGTYVIQKVLGKGGFGITYLALDTKLDKEVAIKEFFPSTLCGRDESTNHITLGTQTSSELVEDLKERFLKEARNIAKLNHPNIIKILSAFEEFNTAYYVMEYIEGESLEQRVIHYGPMAQDYAVRFINPIGHALEYLHENHMMHFDVKPANIMVRSSDNCPILIDFGLSKNYDSAGKQTTIHGPLGVSPGYSPIEQYNMDGSSEFSPKSDLYSLAATMYFILSGNHPKDATSNAAANLVFPSSVSQNVKLAIRKAMSMVAHDRQDTVADFLREINHPEATSTRTVHNPTPAPKQTVEENKTRISQPFVKSGVDDGNKKKKLILAISAGALVVVTVVILCLIFGGDSDDDRYANYSSEYSSGSLESSSSYNDDDEPAAATEVAASTPARSDYGPFSSRSELINFIEDYYEDTRSYIPGTKYLADVFTTNYGTEQTANHSQYLERTQQYRDRIGYENGENHYQWNTLDVTPLDNGGVKAHYYRTYDLTCDQGDGSFVRYYGLTTDLYINSDQKIYKIVEKTKKL